MIRTFFRHFYNEINRRLNLRYFAWRMTQEPQYIRRLIEHSHEHGQPSNPKISVLMPLYQIPLDDFNDCLTSLENQTYPNWELCLCVDGEVPLDGPVETPLALRLRNFELQNPGRLKVHQHKKNQGILAATRSGFKLVTGDYVAFVDGDDLIHKRALELVAAMTSKHPNAQMFYSDHDYLSDWGWRWQACPKPNWSPETLINVNYVNHLTVTKTDFARDVLRDITPECDGAQDWSFAFAAAARDCEVVHIPAALYHWRMRPGSMAWDGNAKPWALRAQTAARKIYVDKMSFEPVRLDTTGQFRTVNPPAVHWVEIDPVAKRDSLVENVRNASSEIIGLRIKGQTLALVDLERSLFYLNLQRTKAVWPFLNNGQRAQLKVSSHPDAFWMFDGNIETGFTHGMLIHKNEFLNWLGRQADEELDSASLGPRIGDDMRQLGYRNVASAGIQVEV